MHGYYIKNIGMNRGKPRIWLEGRQIEDAGLSPGARFDIRTKSGSIILEAKADGSRIVSSKKKGDKEIPVIDINSKDLLALFDGMSAIRMVQKEGEIYLLPMASEIKKKERYTRLKNKLLANETLKIGSLSHGVGVLTHALHSGMSDAGVKTELAFANEIRENLITHAQTANSAWSPSTIPLSAPIQELAFDAKALDSLPKVEILESGLPCSGASVAGRSSRGTKHPEEHPEVGHLVVAALVIIAKVNPAIYVLENVVPYSSSASASILRNQLRDLGYNIHETILEGRDFNEIENRKRWCLVAVSEGVHFDWAMLQRPEKKDLVLSDFLDPIPEDSPLWSEMKGLKAKQERDLEQGKGFKMQVFKEDSELVGTMTKGYGKIRSTDPKLAHPSDPDLLRQFTPNENARFKSIPLDLIEGLSNTIAHEAIGQSISHGAFKAVGSLLGETIKQFAKDSGIDLKDPAAIVSLASAIANEVRESSEFIVSEIKRPVKGSIYEGPITINDLGMIVQDVGNGVGILHESKAIGDVSLNLGERVAINYPKSGLAIVDFFDREANVMDDILSASMHVNVNSSTPEL